ncbi:hypothetical protein A3194_18010 [Candidatus Thiodiazotropha endoloripes]|nr:hypothetical protein A3194_18010 [Candidatus Thiodiazotropha endoloripes]
MPLPDKVTTCGVVNFNTIKCIAIHAVFYSYDILLSIYTRKSIKIWTPSIIHHRISTIKIITYNIKIKTIVIPYDTW